MIEIFPIAVPDIKWETYLGTAKSLIGRSVSTNIDKVGMPLGPPAFLVSLADFSNKQKESLLRHISVSFLAVMLTETLYAFKDETELKISTCDSIHSGVKACVITGNLEQWREAVINCSQSEKIDLTQLANKVQSNLEKMGFQLFNKVWQAGTVKLIPK